jgi:hypothetical protein
MVVSVPFAELFEFPDEMSQKIDEMLFGEEATVLDKTKDFYKIKTDYGYFGWANKESFSEKTYQPNCIVTNSFADLLFEGRNYFRSPLTLPKGARLRVEFSENESKYRRAVLPDERVYYIQKDHIRPLKDVNCDENHLRKALSETAKSYLGVQYRWGGRTFQGVDCSGLCFNTYRFNGINIWRDAVIDKSESLRKIDFAKAKEGDLIFFKGHIALYLGDGHIIHSSASRGKVVIENLQNNKTLKEIYICTGTAF